MTRRSIDGTQRVAWGWPILVRWKPTLLRVAAAAVLVGVSSAPGSMPASDHEHHANMLRELVRATIDTHMFDEPRGLANAEHKHAHQLTDPGQGAGPPGDASRDSLRLHQEAALLSVSAEQKEPDDEDEQKEVQVIVNSVSDSTQGRCPKRQMQV